MRIRVLPLAILVSVSVPLLLAQTPAPSRVFIEGDIVNASGSALLTGARVKLEHDGEESIYGKVDPHGHFVFGDLQPGVYQLVVNAPGFHQSVSILDLRAPSPGNNGVAWTRNSGPIPRPQVNQTTDDDGTIHATVSAPMLPYATIAGKVIDPYGAPVAGASIEIWKPRPEPPQATVAAVIPPSPMTTAGYDLQTMVQADSLGEFRAGKLEPGTYFVLANKPNGLSRWTWQSNYRLTYYPAALDIASAQPLEIEAGQTLRADIQILKQSGVSVSGHLLGLPEDKSLRTYITFMPVKADSMNPDRPYTSGEKNFELSDVLPGRYTLYAQTQDPQSDPLNANRKTLFGLVKDVEIGPQDMAGFDLTLQPMKALAGTVEFADGCPAAPAYVRLEGPSPLTVIEQSTPVAADHTFVLPNIPAGRFHVVVSRMEARYDVFPVASATKGSRDVLKEGLESPWPDDESLKIKVSCGNPGVRP